MMQIWINIIIMFLCAYGSHGILNHVDHQFTAAYWQYYFYAASPWVLLIGSLKAWHRSFVWRRMISQRQAPPVLSRGKHRTEKSVQRPSILEYGSALLLLLALAAIFEQLSIEHAKWWIGSLAMGWIALRHVIKITA